MPSPRTSTAGTHSGGAGASGTRCGPGELAAFGVVAGRSIRVNPIRARTSRSRCARTTLVEQAVVSARRAVDDRSVKSRRPAARVVGRDSTCHSGVPQVVASVLVGSPCPRQLLRSHPHTSSIGCAAQAAQRFMRS